MATLENTQDTIPCRHCGSPVRPGMIRCRECRGLLAEVEDEFVLAPQVAAAAAQPKCSNCGTPLEPGLDHCPNCASALLDDLLKGPEQTPYTPPPVRASREEQLQAQWTSDGTSELRPRQPGSTARPSTTSWTPLPEVDQPTEVGEGDTQVLPAQQRSNPAAQKAAAPQQRRGQAPQKPAAGKPRGKANAPSSIEDDPPGLFGDEDEYASKKPAQPEPARPAPAPAAPAAAAEETSAGSGIETTAACTALLASLATADTVLRIEIATALGKLGDKAALGPLERHLIDPDVRVRRAVATALVQLGHPKGETLLDIAERKPAADVIAANKASSAPRPKPKRSGGGMEVDGDTLKKVGVGIVAIAVIAGGAWYFWGGGGGGSSRRTTSKKSKKPAAAAKAPATKPAPAPSGD